MWAPWPFGGSWRSSTLCQEQPDSGTLGEQHFLAVWPPLNSGEHQLAPLGSEQHLAAAAAAAAALHGLGGLEYGVAWNGGGGPWYVDSLGAPCPLEADWQEQEEASSGMVAMHSGGLNCGGHVPAVWSSHFLCEGGQGDSWQRSC